MVFRGKNRKTDQVLVNTTWQNPGKILRTYFFFFNNSTPINELIVGI